MAWGSYFGTNTGGGGANTINFIVVACATVGAIDLNNAPASIDDYSGLVSGSSLVLIKNQTPDSGEGNPANGIYVWNGAGNSMTRSAIADQWTNFINTIAIIVNGTVNANSQWISNANAGGTLGTTDLGFVKVGGIYTGDNVGIILNNNIFSLKPITAPAHKFAIGVDSGNSIAFAQPDFSDLSGNIAIAQLPNSGVNSTSQLVQLTSSTTPQYPALKGDLITDIKASNVTIQSAFTPQSGAISTGDSSLVALEKLQYQVNNLNYYDNTYTYAQNNLVVYSGAIYRCVVTSSVGVTPAYNSANWELKTTKDIVNSYSSSATININDDYILVDTTAGNVTLSLPLLSTYTASITTKTYTVILQTGTNTLIVKPNGSDTMINGNANTNTAGTLLNIVYVNGIYLYNK